MPLRMSRSSVLEGEDVAVSGAEGTGCGLPCGVLTSDEGFEM